MSEQLTLYTASTSPYAQRVEIALLEANAVFKRYEIDPWNIPEWFKKLVNPAGKVPAITYGGPEAPPEQPSEESAKLAESLVLLEFINDLYPGAHLTPSDPVQRAKMRFFIDAVTTKLWPVFRAFWSGSTGSVNNLLAVLEEFQTLLPNEGFAVGQWSIADAAIAPVLARIELSLEREFSLLTAAKVKECYEEFQSPKFARLRKYIGDIHARSSFKKTWNTDAVAEATRVYLDYLSSTAV